MGEDRTAGPTKFQLLATRGVPTFLLLQGGEEDAYPARPNPEGATLGALAEEIYDRIPPAVRHAWPGGPAVALGKLAEGDFFPSSSASVSAERGGWMHRAFASGRYVRVVNFHATPPRLTGRLEEQLLQLAGSFAPVSHRDLILLMETGEWPHERPGVVLNFFDGFRDNFEVVAPILDRLSLIGWFFVVPGWVATPPKDQRSFAAQHTIDLPYDEADLPNDGRLALSPEEVGDLAGRGHVIASHTHNHVAASSGLTPGLLEHEAAGSRRDLESYSGGPVRALAWLEGTALETNAEADRALANAGYELLFANHAVQRVPRSCQRSALSTC